MNIFDVIDEPVKEKCPVRRDDGTWDLSGVVCMDSLLDDKISEEMEYNRQIQMGQLPGWAK